MADEKGKSNEEQQVQGEGDKEAARRYNRKTETFVDKEGDAAISGPELSDEESREAERAEEETGKRAKEKDPQVSRDYSKPER